MELCTGNLKIFWCVAVGCSKNSFKKNGIKGISFYQLPKHENFKKRLLENIKRVNLPKYRSICHLHFEDGCFKQYLELTQNPNLLIMVIENCKGKAFIKISISTITGYSLHVFL